MTSLQAKNKKIGIIPLLRTDSKGNAVNNNADFLQQGISISLENWYHKS